MSHSHQCRWSGCRRTVSNDVDYCAVHWPDGSLQLARGLELICAGSNIWLVFAPIPGRSTVAAEVNLTIVGRDKPALRQALMAFLEEHMPDGSNAARAFLAECEPHG